MVGIGIPIIQPASRQGRPGAPQGQLGVNPMSEIKLIDIPEVTDNRGQLAFVETGTCCPFRIKRVFWISDVPAGQHRGGHAHLKCRQMLIAIAGSFNVIINGKAIHLSDSTVGLYIPPRVHLDMTNFSKGAVCLVLASDRYDPEDYV